MPLNVFVNLTNFAILNKEEENSIGCISMLNIRNENPLLTRIKEYKIFPSHFVWEKNYLLKNPCYIVYKEKISLNLLF